jgi:hypothetical protein
MRAVVVPAWVQAKALPLPARVTLLVMRALVTGRPRPSAMPNSTHAATTQGRACVAITRLRAAATSRLATMSMRCLPVRSAHRAPRGWHNAKVTHEAAMTTPPHARGRPKCSRCSGKYTG